MNSDQTFVFGSGAMLQVQALLKKVAHLDTTVLLLGESGTGKELAATFLHDNHPARKRGPFIQVHCGAIPETLLESELFGHVKGAFTGADRDRAGVFEQADGGTLLLDEISTMSAQAQVRLLRVLQERRVTRIGAHDSKPVNVRVVVATNENLKDLIDEGSFRLDLYYRINTFPVTLPPLRERPADLIPLTESLGGRIAERMGLPGIKRLSADAVGAMLAYSWPGNVRELENAIEYAFIIAEGAEEIPKEALPPEIADLPPVPPMSVSAVCLTEEGLSFRSAVSSFERELILQSLRLSEGNKARAAGLLDLKRTTFLEKLRRVEQEGPSQPDRLSSEPGESVAV